MDVNEVINVKDAFSDDQSGEQLFVDTWVNKGRYDITGQTFEMKDLLATSNARYWMPKVVEEIIREPVQPVLVIERLLDRISYDAAARITFPAIGDLVAAEIPEGGEYPERSLQIAPGTITVDVGKHGIAVRITEEMRRYSRFDVLALHLRAAKNAMAKHKEQIGFNYINSMGTVVFDNVNPAQSVYGTCTGRNIVSVGNGACTMDDFIKAYSFVLMQGFTPNIVMLHPMTWSMWMADPILRTIAKNTGNMTGWYGTHTTGGTMRPWAKANQGGKGMGSGTQYTPSGNAAGATPTALTGIADMKGAPEIPSYFPYPLTILVSPFVPFDVYNNTADIMLFDSDNLGALCMDEEITTDEWDDPAHDIIKVKMRERYALAIYEDGLGIAIMKNIPVKANEIAFPAVPTISASGTYSELDVTTAIVGL